MLDFILLQAKGATHGATQQASGVNGIMMLVLIVIFVVFFIYLPSKKQKKERQKEEEFRSNLKNGDKVITTSGIIGRIREVKKDNTVILEIADNVKINIHIAHIVSNYDENAKKELNKNQK